MDSRTAFGARVAEARSRLGISRAELAQRVGTAASHISMLERGRAGASMECDLVWHGGREPKAERVLVARCEAITELGTVPVGPGAELKARQQERVRSTLREGISDGLIAIPRFVDHVPSMVANLRRLELVGWNEIHLDAGYGHAAAGGRGFVRAASTDSPFRELVIWGYLRVTGRPGAPIFDIDGWLNDITAT